MNVDDRGFTRKQPVFHSNELQRNTYYIYGTGTTYSISHQAHQTLQQ